MSRVIPSRVTPPQVTPSQVTLLPVPLGGGVSEQPGDAFRVVAEEAGAVRVLQRRGSDGWTDLYAFREVLALPVDFEMAHHYTATFPRSPFRNTLTVQLARAEARHALRGRTYTVRRGTEVATETVDETTAPALLREVFGMDVDDEEVRRALPPPG